MTELAPVPAADATIEGRPRLPVEPPRRKRHKVPLLRYVLGRVLAGVLTLLVVSLLIFLATSVLPGGVAEAVLGKYATPERVAVVNQRLGLDRPLIVQYLDWLSRALHGDLGQSSVQIAQGAESAPISADIATPLRNSLILAILAAAVLFPLSIIVGTLAGIREGKFIDYTLSYAGLLLGSMPEFVIGGFLIVVFFSQFGWFPPVSLVPMGTTPLDNLVALVLPITTLLCVALSFSSRQIRSGVVEVMHQDYVTSARLNGIREKRVVLRYILRNSVATSVQSFAQSLQYLLGGIVVVEALFAYPGIGQALVNAVQLRDVTEVQAIALILAAAYISVNIVADCVVVLLVPKLRTSL